MPLVKLALSQFSGSLGVVTAGTTEKVIGSLLDCIVSLTDG